MKFKHRKRFVDNIYPLMPFWRHSKNGVIIWVKRKKCSTFPCSVLFFEHRRCRECVSEGGRVVVPNMWRLKLTFMQCYIDMWRTLMTVTKNNICFHCLKHASFHHYHYVCLSSSTYLLLLLFLGFLLFSLSVKRSRIITF